MTFTLSDVALQLFLSDSNPRPDADHGELAGQDLAINRAGRYPETFGGFVDGQEQAYSSLTVGTSGATSGATDCMAR